MTPFLYQAEKATRVIVANAIEKSGKSLPQLATEINQLLGAHFITRHYLEYIADAEASLSSSDWNDFWPALCDVPFCIATNDWSLIRHRRRLAKLCGKSSHESLPETQPANAYHLLGPHAFGRRKAVGGRA